MTGWLSDPAFATTAIPVALGVDAFEIPAIAMAIVIFALSLAVFSANMLGDALRDILDPRLRGTG